MSKTRRIEITIETHEITRTRKRDDRAAEAQVIDVPLRPIDELCESAKVRDLAGKELNDLSETSIAEN